ncbi:hypothetical protein ACV07N_11580 [Roseivirga echinicomitans]
MSTLNIVLRFLCLSLIYGVWSCGKSDLVKKETISLSKSEIVINHGDLLLDNFSWLNKIVGADSLLVFDQSNSRFVLFDLVAKTPVWSRTFELAGPDFLDLPILDAEISTDSIFLLSGSYFSIFNTDGTNLLRVELKLMKELGTDFRVHQFQMLSPNKALFSRIPSEAYFPNQTISSPSSLFFIFNFEDFSAKDLPIFSPEEALLSDPDLIFEGGHYQHFMKKQENFLVYNFRFSSKIYRYDINTGKIDQFPANSGYTSNLRKAYAVAESSDTRKTAEYMLGGLIFSSVQFDKETNLYVRLHSETFEKNGRMDRKTFLMLFDTNFNTMLEMELTDKIVIEPIVEGGKIYLKKSGLPNIEGGYEYVVYTIN